MCSTPVTFGGGMTMEYAGASRHARRIGDETFWSSQNDTLRFDGLRFVGFRNFRHRHRYRRKLKTRISRIYTDYSKNNALPSE